VLAYLFWHRPRPESSAPDYEETIVRFHRSLAHRPPVGLRGTWSFRIDELPWLAASGPEGSAPRGGYEDWYLLDDYASLGVLNEAAVGRGHRTAHDHAARGLGAGAGGLYCLQDGEEASLGECPAAVWVGRPPGSAEPVLGELLGDGAPAGHTGLWRRQLVLGPAPEFCLLAPESPAGVSAGRLPQGWSARAIARTVLVGA
jgi:hypothetical protein